MFLGAKKHHLQPIHLSYTSALSNARGCGLVAGGIGFQGAGGGSGVGCFAHSKGGCFFTAGPGHRRGGIQKAHPQKKAATATVRKLVAKTIADECSHRNYAAALQGLEKWAQLPATPAAAASTAADLIGPKCAEGDNAGRSVRECVVGIVQKFPEKRGRVSSITGCDIDDRELCTEAKTCPLFKADDCVIAEVKERCPCLCEETQCGPDDTLCDVLPKADCQYFSCGLLSSPFFVACSLWGGWWGGEGSGKERAHKALTVGKKSRGLRRGQCPVV